MELPVIKKASLNTATIKTSNVSQLPSNRIPSGFPSAVSGMRATLSERQVLTPLLPRHRFSLWELSTLPLGEQTGTPGVTAASPTQESESAATRRSPQLDSVVLSGSQLS